MREEHLSYSQKFDNTILELIDSGKNALKTLPQSEFEKEVAGEGESGGEGTEGEGNEKEGKEGGEKEGEGSAEEEEGEGIVLEEDED